jgi:hypothetical protein
MNKNKLILLLFLAAGCSDKYDSFLRVSVPPIIQTNKDSMNIRIKDYSGYYAGNGLLRISAKDTLAKGLHFTAEDTTGNLEIYYDSATVQGPLPLNQPAWLYIACKSPGLYTLKVSIYDQLGQSSTKRIPVQVWPNEAPVASFRMDLIEQGSGYATYDIVSTSTTRMSKIVEYIFYVNNIATPIYQSKMRVTLYSGTNKIGLQVKDDLGLTSTIKEEQKIIL